MKDYADHFKNKKITVMGLGLLGRGVGDVAFLAEAGAELIVTDLKTEAQLAESLEHLKEFENITYVLGEHRLEDFDPLAGIDLVLVAAGVPFDSEFLQHARAAGIPLKQSAAWFAELSRIPIIGVTGTRGKSTVTNMIHHCLLQATGEDVLLGGNVRGVSNLQLLKQVKEDSLCVMELDSWQLQGWGWGEMSPQVAVFTSFMEDHLNYYEKNDKSREEAMDLYFNDKAQIFLHQDESGVLVTTPEIFERAKTLTGVALGQEVVLADASIIPEDALLAMPGEHNRLNAALAVEALKALSLEEEEIFPALATFGGVEGRLQLLTTIDNVRVYNDNNATTPQATIAALKALDLGNKNVILIAGGADKGIAVESLIEAIQQHCKHVVLIPGSGTDRLVQSCSESPVLVETLKRAVAEAKSVAENGDIILFSPAFASFSQYKNEYERNDEFVALITQVASHAG